MTGRPHRSWARAITQPYRRPLSSRGGLDVDRLPIDVWVDAAGRVRRAILLGDQTLMMLELSDFGAPDPIDLPEPEEILADED